MARTAGKKQAPAKIEEEDDAEGWDDAVVDADDKEAAQNLRLRDWRDVERFREMKELRRLVDDDYGLEEIFHIPLKPRAEPGIPAPHTPAKMPKGAAPPPAKPAAKAAKPATKAPAAKQAPAKAAHPPAKLVHHAKAAKTNSHKAPPRLKAKAKRK
jgi:hypothetical protein